MISVYKIPSIIFTIASILIVLGISIGVVWTSIFHKILLHELILSPTSKTFHIWRITPVPMYMKIHFFNWTNPEEFSSNSKSKPNFVEMGPYVFKEIDYKVNSVWNDNDTLTFQQRKIWTFEESMSNGSLDDVVTNLNPVAATVAFTIQEDAAFIKKVVNGIMNRFNEKLVIRKTVRELLFEGYKDELLVLAKKTNMTKLPYQKFGWFYGRNESDTYDGTFNLLRGEKNIHDLGKVVKWNYNSRAERYSEEQCDHVQGTIGDLWPPLVHNKTVDVFVPDICTHLTLTYANESEYLGLTGYNYISNKTMLNKKCCTSPSCQTREGTMFVGPCKYGAPVYISLPHFYLADESYRNSISGMKPDKQKHEFSLTIEPTTGIPMNVRAQLQINMLVQPDKDITVFKNVPKTYIPLLWFRQEANLTSNYSRQVKFLLTLPMLGHVTLFGIGGIGALLFFVGVFICSRSKWQNEDNQILLKD